MEKKELNQKKFSGINRLLQSDSLQGILNKWNDGTFSAFVDDWRWILSYSRRHIKAIWIYLFFGILSTTLGIVSSVVSKYLIDIIVGRKIDQLWMLALMMVFSTVFSLFFSGVVSRISLKISIDVGNDIQADIFSQIMDAQWMELNRYSSGDLLNRFNSDVHTVSANAISWGPSLIISIYHFVTTFCVILYYDATMAFIALASAPFLLFMSRYFLRKNREHRERLLRMNSKLMSFEVETFHNIDTIKGFGIMNRYREELRKRQNEFKSLNLDYNTFQIRTGIATKLISAAVTFAAFGYCLFRLWNGAITYGTMTLFLQQRTALSNQFNALVGIVPGMFNSSVSAHRLRELAELPRERHNPQAASELYDVMHKGLCISMKDVEFSYEDDQKIVRNGDFIARPGEIIALVGPSGEGKTTMLRLILGLVSPQEGSVVLSGRDGETMEVGADSRCFFSYVPQGNSILSGTVAENLRMVKDDATDDEIMDALKTACAWDFVSKNPKGIAMNVAERGNGLSEGQAQRIAIARAVLRDAPILLLDEATSALDVATERQVLRNIVKQHPNKICIVTTHRPSVLNMCQRVYRIVDSNVREITEEESSRLVMDY